MIGGYYQRGFLEFDFKRKLIYYPDHFHARNFKIEYYHQTVHFSYILLRETLLIYFDV